ncbi:uncharacterized protein [Triticum aestivum]|uniref:uncharacterized protein n=1 Tax=Triticum aestivum TaxID=4565 RepID=UPI001D032DF2|nr:uncharacterized protein LOC123076302 [Triticum aestivum]
MNQLSRKLYIRSLVYVESWKEAVEARLVDKQYLKDLSLHWKVGPCKLRTSHNGVLEGLHPPSSMEHLQIEQFGGDSFPPSWLQPQNLPSLKSMYLVKCDGLERIVLPRATPEADALISSFDGVLSGSVGADGSQQASTNNYACLPFTSLTLLVLLSCRKLKNLDQCLSPEYFPSIQSIQLLFCESLESIPVDKFGGFVCLHDLQIMHCRSLVCPREMVLPKSLERLYIEHSGKLDRDSCWTRSLYNPD